MGGGGEKVKCGAAVVVDYGGAQPGFVLAGRSLRESQAETTAGAAWLVTLAVSLVVVALSEIILADKKSNASYRVLRKYLNQNPMI